MGGVPDPIFSRPNIKEKIAVWLRETSGHTDLHDQMIDRIVVGIRNSRLSQKIQMEADLMLEKAVSLARQNKTVNTQQPTVRRELPQETSIEAVRGV